MPRILLNSPDPVIVPRSRLSGCRALIAFLYGFPTAFYCRSESSSETNASLKSARMNQNLHNQYMKALAPRCICEDRSVRGYRFIC